MWKEVLLCLCGVTALVFAYPAVPASQRAKRAVPAFVAAAAKEVGGKVVTKLGDRIAEGVVENHQEKVIGSLENYFSGQFDKADEEFDKVLERSGDLLGGLGGGVEQARVRVIHGRGLNTGDTFSPPGYELRMDFEREDGGDDSNQDSSDGMSPAFYPQGIGPLLMNGCFGSNYAKGDPCYKAKVPMEACANIIDGATYLGVGFDGRGEYSTVSRKKSLIQRACEGLQGYKEYHVPDIMTVQGIYNTDVETYTFGSIEEYRHYLEDKSAVMSAKAMFQQEMNKASGHMGVGGPFGLIGSAGRGRSSEAYNDLEMSNALANSQAGAELTMTSSRLFMAMMELNVFRYEMFLDFVGPENLNLAFLRDFLNLPGTYFAIGANKAFQKFILRWGTHYITSAKFGGQLKFIKTKEASSEDSKQTFVTAAQSDFKMLFSTYSAKQTQTKSGSWLHSEEKGKEKSKSAGDAFGKNKTSESVDDKGFLSEYEFSNEVLEVQGGDQKIAVAITEFYTTSFGDTLKDWLESIEEFPKAFEFRMLSITDLLDMNFDSFFPHGNKDFGCFGRKTVYENGTGHKYYVEDKADGNSTTSEIRYCKYAKQTDVEQAITKRRLALNRAIAVYLEEGPFLSSDFQIPAGEPGCETAELALVEDSINGVPSWQEMINGQEFKVVFSMPYNIPKFVTARATLRVRFMSRTKKWLTIREGRPPDLFDGHRNGNSGDVSQHKVSVGGLVMTYDEDTGSFTVTQEDFDASAAAILDLPPWINGTDMEVARAEYKSLLEQLSQQQSSTGGQVPCNLQWSNAHRIDPTDGGKCIHFTAASEGDIFLVFAGVPKDHHTWVTVEISTSGVAIYKALRLAVTQLDKGAKGLGSDTLYTSYFVCLTEDLAKSSTTVQFGKTPDNEDRGHVWLNYQFSEVLSLHYYAFGSGEHPVKLMGVSQIFKPTDLNAVCREGTVKKGDRCVQVCHAECKGCKITGSDDPRDCISCKNVRIAYPYIDGSPGDFECVAACPANMTQAPGTISCRCTKRMEETAADGTVTCVAECPLTHFDDDGMCKRCSSLCSDVSGEDRTVCTGPAADQCTVCAYRAADGSCLEGCIPGYMAVATSLIHYTGNTVDMLTCAPCRPGYKCVKGDEVEELCPSGTYSRGDGTTCDPCTVGEYSSSGASVCQLCPAGTFSAQSGLPSCDPCPAGKYSSNEGSTSCQDCPAGQYSSAGSTSCQDCPAGKYSQSGSPACQLCPAGNFNTRSGSDSCDPCPAGQYSSTEGSTSCQDCPAGQYSSSGSSACQLCPAGQHNTQSGSASCDPCPAGKYSPSEGSTSCQVCQRGNYSPRGSSACQLCPAGKFNTQNGLPNCDPCPAGKYSPSSGSTGCYDCLAGQYSSIASSSCQLCPAGTYSHCCGSSTCHPCRAGFYSTQPEASTCELCPAGKYSSSEGSSGCDPCPAGQFSVMKGSTSCMVCPAGMYSSSGSLFCQQCPAGQSSSTEGSTSCQVCPEGTYSSSGSSACELCLAGTYSNQTGSPSCDPCPAGQYSPSTGSTSCETCAAGYYSWQGAHFCGLCFPGTYSSKGSSICQLCPAGTYNSLGLSSTCQLCPVGKYSSSNGSTSCESCPAGKYSSSSGSSACTSCPAGQYTNTDGSTGCLDCRAGFTSNAGATRCNICETAGYVYFGRCYKDFAELKTYSEAEQTCAADGGMLAMPRISVTNTFIHDLGGRADRWIGLTYAQKEGMWVFGDGQPLVSSSPSHSWDYSRWHPDQPSGADNEECVVVGYGSLHLWDDLPCDYRKGFVCQKD